MSLIQVFAATILTAGMGLAGLLATSAGGSTPDLRKLCDEGSGSTARESVQPGISAIQPEPQPGVPPVETEETHDLHGILVDEDETRPVATPLAHYTRESLGGFWVLLDPEALAAGRDFRRVRAALLFDLERVAEVLPPAALERVRETPIVLTLRTPARPGWEGASAACLHVSADWLSSHGFDPERAGVVEILHMDKYLLSRAEQPMMLLHELAHAYHLSLEDGYGHGPIADAYIAASQADLYSAVGYILADEGQTRPAYAGTNPQEYFAELSEAYFGRNDYYPFTREDLREHDPAGYAMIEAVWGVIPAGDDEP